jgi:NAD-dependent dihydropyrimidine dehydrogenase PreA subunit
MIFSGKQGDDSERAPTRGGTVTYVIAEPCIDVVDRACVDECPVDCIYEGRRALYIHPDECVDCGACEPVCPVQAIFYEDDVPDRWSGFTEDNARFFNQPLAGRDAPLGSPGGAARVSPLHVDTQLVTDHLVYHA